MRIPASIKFIIVAAAVGGIFGVGGAAITTIYLTDYAGWVAELSLPVSPSRDGRASVNDAEAVREKVLGAVVQVFPLERGSALRMYRPDRALASGVVLTSDGWLLVPTIPSVDLSKAEFIIGRAAYKADRVEQETLYPFSFVKIAAQNLPVVAFGEGLSVSSGDRVFAAPSRQALLSTSVFDMRFGTELVRSSDMLARRWFLAESSAFPLLGSPVVDQSGSLIGMVEAIESARPRILPIEALIPAFQSLLQKGLISHPALGLRGIDVSRAVGLPASILSRGMENGFFVYGRGSVASAGAAKSAGIAEGDIILSIEGQALGYRKSLDEYLASLRPGDEIALRIDRAGKLMDMRATLGSDRP